MYAFGHIVIQRVRPDSQKGHKLVCSLTGATRTPQDRSGLFFLGGFFFQKERGMDEKTAWVTFAAAAIQGILANPESSQTDFSQIYEHAHDVADNMTQKFINEFGAEE